MNPSGNDLLSRAYAAFNARDIDAVLAALRPDVAWPNGSEGGYIHGHEAVREYWTRQWSQASPNVEPQRFTGDADGRVVVEVLQTVRDLAGAILREETVEHVYQLNQGRIARMEIRRGLALRASVNGVDLCYADVGAGPGVLLVHGHPFDRTMWTPQVEVLKDRHRVIAPDLRGYGSSSLPTGCRETTLETFAADHLALMDTLGIATFALGGLSMGGQIVLEMYRQSPERITSLLLADTFAGLDTVEGRQLRLTTADRLEREGMDAYAGEVLHKMITPANAAQFPEVAAHVIEMMTTTPPAGAAAALRGRSQRRDYLPLLREIRVPTLVVVGREDAYTPVPVAEQLVAGIAGAKLAVIEDAGHMPNLERPDAFNGAFESWLTAGGRTRGSAPTVRA